MLIDYKPRVHDVTRITSTKFYLRILVTLRKLSVQHSTTATQAMKAFLISNIRCFIILVRRLGVTPHAVSYKAYLPP